MAEQTAASAFPPGLVVYQIYCRSFKDSNGDGVGDLGGVLSQLDYLKELGITAIWLSPIYPSPNVDFGYDISDYYEVDPEYGTLDQLDELIAEAHQRGIKVMLDIVINHTSDQHQWFKESRSSRDNPKRDWYVWEEPGPDGAPPNNWLSVFGGSAWELDPKTDQYYLHSFAKAQPDLNWHEPAVREAIKDVARFWLDRGIDGLRVDAANWIAEDPKLRNDPVNPNFRSDRDSAYDSLRHRRSRDMRQVYAYLNELAAVMTEYDDRFMIIEARSDLPLNIEVYTDFYNHIEPTAVAPFNFTFLYLPWEARIFRWFVDGFQAGLGPNHTPVYVYGNHDDARLASRYGQEAARAAALIQLTLPGAAVIYYGEELGMENVSIPATAVKDIFEKTMPDKGRDPFRTPMQWSDQPHAGFSSSQPWLPLGDYLALNVEQAKKDRDSLLNLYQKLLSLRAQSTAIKHGTYQPLDINHPDFFGFERETDDEKLAILVNFSDSETIALDVNGEQLLSTSVKAKDNQVLQPLEAKLIKIK